jgi:hypothetical protein
VATERPLRTLSVLLACTLLGGCAASGTRDAADSKKVTPLQLWSHHKSLDMSASACGDKGLNILTTLSFTDVVRKDNYVYGVFGESRAAVKCVEMPKGSFVYFAVASRDKETAEQLRNAISAKM